MDYELSVEKTAITNGVSSSCKMLIEEYKNEKVLDYGFGKLRNTKYMLKNNVDLDILDTVEQIEKCKDEICNLNIKTIYKSNERIKSNTYDKILLSFVLNVVPEKIDREFILDNIYSGLKEEGLLYLEVRDNNFLKTTKNKIEYNDGFVLGAGKKRTFQKPYDLEDISKFLIDNNFKIETSRKRSGSIILICKKNKSL